MKRWHSLCHIGVIENTTSLNLQLSLVVKLKIYLLKALYILMKMKLITWDIYKPLRLEAETNLGQTSVTQQKDPAAKNSAFGNVCETIKSKGNFASILWTSHSYLTNYLPSSFSRYLSMQECQHSYLNTLPSFTGALITNWNVTAALSYICHSQTNKIEYIRPPRNVLLPRNASSNLLYKGNCCFLFL